MLCPLAWLSCMTVTTLYTRTATENRIDRPFSLRKWTRDAGDLTLSVEQWTKQLTDRPTDRPASFLSASSSSELSWAFVYLFSRKKKREANLKNKHQFSIETSVWSCFWVSRGQNIVLQVLQNGRTTPCFQGMKLQLRCVHSVRNDSIVCHTVLKA